MRFSTSCFAIGFRFADVTKACVTRRKRAGLTRFFVLFVFLEETFLDDPFFDDAFLDAPLRDCAGFAFFAEAAPETLAVAAAGFFWVCDFVDECFAGALVEADFCAHVDGPSRATATSISKGRD